MAPSGKYFFDFVAQVRRPPEQAMSCATIDGQGPRYLNIIDTDI
jgi:hypothetical protein